MSEIVLYRSRTHPVERVLPPLLEKSLEQGKRACVRFADSKRLAFFDDHLWNYRDDGFLPHGQAGREDSSAQPILLTEGAQNENGAAFLFLLDGAPMEEGDPGVFARICILFDGADAGQLAMARDVWRRTEADRLPALYWEQAEDGRWRKKAERRPASGS